jgi:transcriptional regulator with XRE-family HTH domain
MATFGELLRERRRAAGITQRDLASRIGVDFSYISKLENDRLPPPASETASKIAAALACPIEELLSAARKLPSGVENAISSAPGALRFLQRARDLDLTHEEWDQLLSHLDDLRREKQE